MWMQDRQIDGHCLGCLFLIIYLLWTNNTYAQPPAVKLPPQVEPHRQTLPAEPVAPKPEPKIQVDSGTQMMPQRAHEIDIEEFGGVRLLGGSVYPEQDLEKHYRGLIGTKITLARVYQIARDIQGQYRSDGYLLTRVVIPKQTVTDYVFEIRIIEGYIERVRIEGDTSKLRYHIDSLLQKIAQNKPANLRELERYLLLINDLPGVTARAILRPAKEGLGASELVLRVERKPFEGFALINNRGSEYTGPWRGMWVNRTNSLLGLGERIELLLMSTPNEEQRYAGLYYKQPIGSEGQVFDLNLSYGPSEPGYTLGSLGMETTVAYFGVSTLYPWLRSRKRNLFFEFGFDATNSDVDMLGMQFTQDRLRVLHAGGSYDFIGQRGGHSKFGLSVRQGLSGLGASSNDDPDRSRLEGRSDFTSIQLFGSYHQSLFGHTALQLAGKAQYAFQTLLSDEEFRLGGEQFGRGYDPSELAGEKGVAFSAELQQNFWTASDMISEYQLYGFYDIGMVWNEDTGAIPRESLASAGVGVRARSFEHFTLSLEVAKPLTREVAAEGNKDPRIYLQVSAHY